MRDEIASAQRRLLNIADLAQIFSRLVAQEAESPYDCYGCVFENSLRYCPSTSSDPDDAICVKQEKLQGKIFIFKAKGATK